MLNNTPERVLALSLDTVRQFYRDFSSNSQYFGKIIVHLRCPFDQDDRRRVTRVELYVVKNEKISRCFVYPETYAYYPSNEDFQA